jgi:hypothetical protein
VYLRIQFAIIFVLLLGLAGFNYVVDPYGIYSPEKLYSFNKNKTEFFMKEAAIKPYRVSDVKPDTLILGLSGAGLGYDESHAHFSDKNIYNFSMAGASMYMVYRAFQHALVETQLDSVLLDLSIISFNEYHALAARDDSDPNDAVFEGLIAAKEDGSYKWIAFFRKLSNIPLFLLSSQVTQDSLATLKRQSADNSWNLNSRGGWRGSTLPLGQSQGKRFLKVQQLLFNGFFNDPSTSHPFSIYREDGSLSRSFDYYERFLEDAYSNNIQVTLVFSPSHSYFYEALEYLGLDDMFTDWKRTLVLINEKVASRYGKSPYPIWDFAYYSELTTEPVPARKNNTARMKWHFDPLHIKRAAGNLVLDQVYLGGEGTGIALNTDNVDSVLEMQQQKKQLFHQEHAELIKQLKAMFKRVTGTNPQ